MRTLFTAFTFLASIIMTSLIYMWDRVKDFMVETTEWLWDQLPAGWTGWLNDTQMSGALKAAVEGVTYFLPVGAMSAIVAGAFSIAASIRLIRWIKSFVPTIGD